MPLKTDTFWILKIDSSTHAPSALIVSTTTPCEVYTASHEAFSKMTYNCLALQDRTKSTNWVKLVEWAIWCWVRKWMQRTRDFIAYLLLSLSCIPILCNCWITLFCFGMTSRTWLAWVWSLLLSWGWLSSNSVMVLWLKHLLCACGALCWGPYSNSAKTIIEVFIILKPAELVFPGL